MNNDYWRERAEKEEAIIFENTKKTVNKTAKMYKKTLEEIQATIDRYIKEFAYINGNLSISKAKQVLNKNELKEFQMTVNEYIARASKNNITPKENIELINASLKHRIDRLEALKTEINIHLNELASKQVEITQEKLGEIYQSVYYDTAYNTYQMTGQGKFINGLDTRSINLAIKEIWTNDGLGFSDRIWSDRNKLANELYTALFQSIALGKNAYDTVSDLNQFSKDKSNKAVFNIARLLQTEASVIRAKATFDSYKATGVEKYQVVATLDGKTCDRCASFDYKVYLLKDLVIGVNCNPFHPMCRCTNVPYYGEDTATERIARDENGNQYIVGNLSYSEWVEKYVKNKEQLKGYEQYARYKKVLGDKVPNSFDKFVDMKYNNSRKYIDLKTRYYIKTKAKLTVHQGKQEKHILGRNNYQGGSYVFDTIDIQDLVNKYAGSGRLVFYDDNKWNNIEFIEHTENIGIYISLDKKEQYETKRFSIHYSKKGTHIVPRKDK